MAAVATSVDNRNGKSKSEIVVSFVFAEAIMDMWFLGRGFTVANINRFATLAK